MAKISEWMSEMNESPSYQKSDKPPKSVDLCKECILRTAKPCAPRTRKPKLYCTTLKNRYRFFPMYNIQWGKKVRLQTWKHFYFLFQSHDDKVSTCLHVDRFAVLLTVSCSFNITLIQFGKRFFKTQIWSMHYKFLCENFRLSHGSKKSKKYACDKRKRSIQNMELFLHSPLTKYAHIYKTIDL